MAKQSKEAEIRNETIETKKTLKEGTDKIKNGVDETKEVLQDKTEQVKNELNDKKDELKEKVNQTADDLKVKAEEIKVKGKDLLNKVKELLHESNIRRIRIKKDGKIVVEIPLSVATVGVILAPVMASIGALAAVLTECTIEVERAE